MGAVVGDHEPKILDLVPLLVAFHLQIEHGNRPAVVGPAARHGRPSGRRGWGTCVPVAGFLGRVSAWVSQRVRYCLHQLPVVVKTVIGDLVPVVVVASPSAPRPNVGIIIRPVVVVHVVVETSKLEIGVIGDVIPARGYGLGPGPQRPTHPLVGPVARYNHTGRGEIIGTR